MPAATTPRRSTPRRARSSSVASNTSRSSSRAPASRGRGSTKKSDRPTLPTERNPKLPGAAVPVKLQTIVREEQKIIIGRVKLDTVNGSDHGFLLKRFDTNAIAASSMFRLAFPYADGEAEREEMAYLDSKYDTVRANGGLIEKPKKIGRPKKVKDGEEAPATPGKVLPEGSTGVRLQGTWLPCEDALDIADEYGLLLYAKPLIEATAELNDGGQPQFVGSSSSAYPPPSNDSDAAPPATPKSKKAGSTAGSPPNSNRKRQRTSKESAAEESEAEGAAGKSPKSSSSTTTTPKATRSSRTKKSTKADGTSETTTTKVTTVIEPAQGMTQKEIDEQIKKSRELAQEVQKSKTGEASTSGRGRKRRASNDRPSADIDRLADEAGLRVNAVSRTVRRGARAVRRRPVATTAGVMGVATAAGVGALAWLAGGQVDVAQQLLQQGLQQGMAVFQQFFF